MGKPKPKQVIRAPLGTLALALAVLLLFLSVFAGYLFPQTVLFNNSSNIFIGQTVSVTCEPGLGGGSIDGTYTINWADGIVSTGVINGPSVTVTHVYYGAGSYVAFCSLFTVQGQFAGTGSTDIIVQAAPVTSTYTTTSTNSQGSTTTATKTTVSSDTSTYSPAIDSVTTTITQTQVGTSTVTSVTGAATTITVSATASTTNSISCGTGYVNAGGTCVKYPPQCEAMNPAFCKSHTGWFNYGYLFSGIFFVAGFFLYVKRI